MHSRRTATAACFLLAAAAMAQNPDAPALPQAAPFPTPAMQATLTPGTATRLTKEEEVLQVLNRFTYGPRPGELERVRAEGLAKWFADQLNPQRIDDSALDRRLADYPAMQLPVARMMELFPDSNLVKAVLAGKASTPSGPGEKAIYQAQEERYKDKGLTKKGEAVQAREEDPPPLPMEPAAILALPAPARFALLSKLTPAQLKLLSHRLQRGAENGVDQRDALFADFTPKQVETLAAFGNPEGVITSELLQTKLLRDLYSERQLQEMMVDFWLNHFNVYIKKNQQAPYFIAAFERDTIRPNALGNFETLLKATATSAAMLSYLDNAQSVGPHSESVLPQVSYTYVANAIPKGNKAASGLNENYARELMELHTLGVNGGYTQADVTAVARVFTGWTIGRPPGGGEAVFPEFDASKHEPGDKVVLGHKIKMNGEAEGMEVLHMLAQSPVTARFVSTKLAIRFVSDDPPPAMIDRMVAAWAASHADIRQVLLAMINSPEFFTRATFRAKVKTPQDYVLSAVRASGADVRSASALAAAVAELGMPVFGMQTPNGYSMRADPWNSTAALIDRMNFALALASNRVAGISTDWPALLAALPESPASSSSLEPLPHPAALGQNAVPPRHDALSAQSSAPQALSPERKEQLLDDHLLHVPVSDRTRAAILSQITQPADQQRRSLNGISTQALNRRDALGTIQSGHTDPGRIPVDPQTALAAGLLFGSPEFQRR